MRRLLGILFLCAMVVSAGAQAGFWSELKEGIKSGAHDLDENSKEARADLRDKAKKGLKAAGDATEETVSETREGMKKAWKRLKN